MKKLILFIVVFLTNNLSISQVIYFPDLNFKNALLNNSPNIDLNHNGNIEVSEAHLTELINVDNKNITNLTGLSYFINLRTLSCQDNNISTLDLSNLTQLSFVVASNINLNSIILNNLPSLNTLYCNGNNLANINLSQTPNLQWLVCNDNNLAEIDVSKLSKLEYFYCNINKLTSLNLSNLNNLHFLLCQYNQINNLDLANCLNITDLWCNNNSLKTLNYNNLTQLKNYYCDNNQFSDVNLSLSIKLERFSCSFNSNISNLDLSSNPNLIALYADNNSIVNLNVKNNQIFNDVNFFKINSNLKLQNICCDAGELSFLSNYLNKNSMDNVLVNSNCSLGTTIPNFENNIGIYPNPISDLLKIKSTEIIKKVNIYDLSSKEIYAKTYNENEINIDFKQYSKGIYLLKITNQNGEIKTLKLIKK